MISEIIMPQGGQDLEKGKVVKWLKNEGEPVKKGDVVCEIETEKATIEVPSRQDGYLRKILIPAGNEAPILSVIGVIGELSDPIDKYLERTGAQLPSVKKGSESTDKFIEYSGQSSHQLGKIRISPKAKKIALQNHVPLDTLKGSGPLGRIVVQDILKVISQAKGKEVASLFGKSEGGKVISLNKIRKITAQRMLLSKQTIPHFYVTLAVDMTQALSFRQKLNQQHQLSNDDSVTINDLIVKACAMALQAYPEMNASYQDEDHLVLHENINISIAVSIENGLIVPVVESVDQYPIFELSRKIREVVKAAREGKQLTTVPSRFTISNLGMYNIDEFSAIINPPEAAILAVSTIRKKVEVDENGTFIVRDKVNLTLSIDHRICDGVQACKFINKTKDLLESPELLE